MTTSGSRRERLAEHLDRSLARHRSCEKSQAAAHERLRSPGSAASCSTRQGGPPTLNVDSPLPARTTMMSAGTMEGLPLGAPHFSERRRSRRVRPRCSPLAPNSIFSAPRTYASPSRTRRGDATPRPCPPRCDEAGPGPIGGDGLLGHPRRRRPRRPVGRCDNQDRVLLWSMTAPRDLSVLGPCSSCPRPPPTGGCARR